MYLDQTIELALLQNIRKALILSWESQSNQPNYNQKKTHIDNHFQQLMHITHVQKNP